MAHEAKEMKFLATPEKGEVSTLLVRPGDASHLLVLGHGASTNMRHATLQTIAGRLADAGIATFRYNFPYMEHGRGRDSQEVCTATVRSALSTQQFAQFSQGISFKLADALAGQTQAAADLVERLRFLIVEAKPHPQNHRLALGQLVKLVEDLLEVVRLGKDIFR